MRIRRRVGVAVAGAVILLAGMHGSRALGSDVSHAPGASSQSVEAIARFAKAWADVRSYECVVSIHEVEGSHVQDRVMRVTFEKPYNTRVDILAGEGHGGAIVWRGGDKVRGHEGGFLSAIKVDVDVHDRRVTSLRGATVAEANWGALYDHLTSLRPDSVQAVVLGDTTTLTYAVPDPPGEGNVTKEVLMLGGNSLPIEYDQYIGDELVSHVTTSDVKLNINPPDSTWSI
ncbi:MAG: hypothetical protein JOZ28_08440 [Candidatus Eremiobacteraeota bacterium]|nr:hypothetical protein [Candidatus Eremiobacteraeota bacterium]